MWWTLVACSGSPVPQTVADPVPEVATPEGWGVVPQPFADRLREGELTCASGRTSYTWRPDLSFEAATPRAKFAGTWRSVDDGVVHLTSGPIGDRQTCSSARVLPIPDRPVVLCAEGPLGCVEAVDWAIEVVDDGAGADASERVARVLGTVSGSVVVYPASETGSGGQQISVAYRLPPSGRIAIREFAEELGALLEGRLDSDGVEVVADPNAAAPVTVRVGGRIR